MRFWDSSALIPLVVDEPRTARIRPLVEADPSVAVWWGTLVECFSALARLRRDEILTTTDERHARDVLARLSAAWTEVQPTPKVRDRAARILLLHPLAAADSLQLAAALVWAEGEPSGHELVCLDDRLRQASGSEGFAVLP